MNCRIGYQKSGKRCCPNSLPGNSGRRELLYHHLACYTPRKEDTKCEASLVREQLRKSGICINLELQRSQAVLSLVVENDI